MRTRDKNENINCCMETYRSASLNSSNLIFLKQGFHSVDFWIDRAEVPPCLLAFPGTRGQYSEGAAGGKGGMLIAEPTQLGSHRIWEKSNARQNNNCKKMICLAAPRQHHGSLKQKAEKSNSGILNIFSK